MRVRSKSSVIVGSVAAATLMLSAQYAEAQDEDDILEVSDPQTGVPASIEVVDPMVVEELEERLREAEDLLDKIETRSLLQRIQWSGDYRTMVTNSRYSGPSIDGARDPMTGAPIAVDLQNDEQWLHRVRLNMEAKPYKDLRFTGRLVMFKRFGSNTATLFAQDSSESRIPRDTTPRFERAWVDWFFHEKAALSLGRISYSNGSPNELSQNLEESDASWGMHMVDGEYETINLTVSPTDNILARAFYIAWAFPVEGDVNSFYLPLTNGTKALRIIGGNVDFKMPSIGAFTQLGAYVVPKFRPFTVPIPNFIPAPNPNNAPPPFDGSLNFPSSKSPTLGSYANVSALVMFKDVAGTGLDLFASAAIGFLKPEPGAAISYDVDNFLAPGSPKIEDFPVLGLSSAEKCWNQNPINPMMPGPLITPKTECETTQTYFGYFGARYTLPLKSKRAPKFGFEYNFTSKHWISFNVPRMDLSNKLANRGSAFEGYAIFPFNEFLFLKVHALTIQTDYDNGFFGPIPNAPGTPFAGTAAPKDAQLTIFGAALNAKF